jgi:hypothetical protein
MPQAATEDFGHLAACVQSRVEGYSTCEKLAYEIFARRDGLFADLQVHDQSHVIYSGIPPSRLRLPVQTRWPRIVFCVFLGAYDGVNSSVVGIDISTSRSLSCVRRPIEAWL